MKKLNEHLEEYLTLRRKVGYKLRVAGGLLIHLRERSLAERLVADVEELEQVEKDVAEVGLVVMGCGAHGAGRYQANPTSVLMKGSFIWGNEPCRKGLWSASR